MGNPLSTGESKIGICGGATWGTAADIATASSADAFGLVHGRVALSTARGEFRTNDVGFSNKLEEIVKLEQTIDVTFTCDLSYHGNYLGIMAYVMNNIGNASETTSSQGDYSHEMKLSDSNNSRFFTMAFLAGEDDNAIEIPSVKFHSFTINHDVNGVGTFTAQGIADDVVIQADTPQNTVAEFSSFPDYPTYQPCVLGGSSHYFRQNANSGGALSGSEDMEILGYTLSVSRPLEREFTLRGASTPYTAEPKQLGYTIGSLEVRYARVEDSVIDILNTWDDETKQKMEIFFDGDQINSGVNTSLKLQFPYAEIAGAMPGGFDLPNNNTRMRPVVSYNLLKASSAPSGMTGVTDYLAVTTINERSANYT